MKLTAGASFGGKRSWSGVFYIQFGGPQVAWNVNGLEAEAQIPELSLNPPIEGSAGQRLLPSDPNVTIDYYIPDSTGYDWVGGPEPTVVPGHVEWTEPLSALTAPVPVDGTNTSAAEWDSVRTFAAGALIGVAGGALVGAIQESTHRKEKTAPHDSPDDSNHAD